MGKEQSFGISFEKSLETLRKGFKKSLTFYERRSKRNLNYCRRRRDYKGKCSCKSEKDLLNSRKLN